MSALHAVADGIDGCDLSVVPGTDDALVRDVVSSLALSGAHQRVNASLAIALVNYFLKVRVRVRVRVRDYFLKVPGSIPSPALDPDLHPVNFTLTLQP